MFFWKFTRSGRYSTKYISLIIDIHESRIIDGQLNLSFLECQDIMMLIHDVETLNGKNNYSAGLLKRPFQEQVNKLGFRATNAYVERRNIEGLVQGQMTLGVHDGEPLDYGISNRDDEKGIFLDTDNLKITMMINAKTGIIYGYEDKLKAYRDSPYFINDGKYFDLMPMHNCMIEIVSKMFKYDHDRTKEFLINVLKWEEL